MKTIKLINTLKEHDVQIYPEDSIYVAARKILLAESPLLLECEEGCLIGKDTESIHHMRVSCRRIRSAIDLLIPYYDQKRVLEVRNGIQRLGKHLGMVRDLDVLLMALDTYFRAEYQEKNKFELIVKQLHKYRGVQQRKLGKYFFDKEYRKTLKGIRFYGRKPIEEEKRKKITPIAVRHVLPFILHKQLAVVRGFDDYIETGNAEVLHRLRIEVKRLRYILTQFSLVLGRSATPFVRELKLIQDNLGSLNDVDTARKIFSRKKIVNDMNGQSFVEDYLISLQQQEHKAQSEFASLWRRFNTRRVRRLFSDALLVLR